MLMDEEFIIDQAKTGQLTQAIGHESGQKNQYWLTEQLQSKKSLYLITFQLKVKYMVTARSSQQDWRLELSVWQYSSL